MCDHMNSRSQRCLIRCRKLCVKSVRVWLALRHISLFCASTTVNYSLNKKCAFIWAYVKMWPKELFMFARSNLEGFELISTMLVPRHTEYEWALHHPIRNSPKILIEHRNGNVQYTTTIIFFLVMLPGVVICYLMHNRSRKTLENRLQNKSS